MGAPRTAFDAEYGTKQGRIEPSEYDNLSGSFVIQLGHDTPGTRRFMVAGDTITVSSTFDLTGLRLIRFRTRHRPAETPFGYTWRFFASINSSGGGSIDRVINREVEAVDMALPTEGPILDAGNSTLPVTFSLLLDGPPVDVVEIELPGIWVDALVADEGGKGLQLFSRDPEPGEDDVPLSAPIKFVVAYIDGSGTIVPSDLTVTVDGVPAITNGVIQGGFFGSVTPITGSADLGLAVVIQHPINFTSLATIEVVASLPAHGFEVSWSFTTEDTIAPIVESAFAPSPTTVRVVFDEPMDPETLADPASYMITLIGGAPAVTPLVLSVEVESERAVILTLNKIMTRGALYQVAVTDAEDVSGNQITAPENTGNFAGYRWPVPPGRDTNLFGRLPENVRRQDETGEHERFLGVMQEVFDVFYGLADKALDIVDPDYAPIEWVDRMLSDLGNPFDFLDLTEIEKRILVQTLLAVFKTKGTGPGIVNALRFFLGIEASIRVYAWSPVGLGEAIFDTTFVLGSSEQSDLYTFEVVVTEFLTETERRNLTAIVDYMKVAHEHWRLIEPTEPVVIDHWQLDFSLLGTQTILHPP